jgi:hypothetical protein
MNTKLTPTLNALTEHRNQADKLIDTIVQSTKDWLTFLDYKGFSEATEEDIVIGLEYDHSDILGSLRAGMYSEYVRTVKEVLDRLYYEDSVDE